MPYASTPELLTQKNKLEQKDPWVYLCEVELTTGVWYRVTTHVRPVVYDGKLWISFPVAVSDIKFTSKGEVQTATVSISNVAGTLTAYLYENNGLAGKQGNVYLVNLNGEDWYEEVLYESASQIFIPEFFTIIAVAGQDIVVFTLALSADAYNVEGPTQSYDRDKFPAMPSGNPRVSLGII